MNAILAIRRRLKVTQTELARGLGCTQGNVHHYERGQTMPPPVARRLIAYAESKGQRLTFDEVYAEDVPDVSAPGELDVAHTPEVQR